MKTMMLTPEAFDHFMEVINNPPPPTQALIDLMREHGRFAKDLPPRKDRQITEQV